MPIYEFKCSLCGNTKDVLLGFDAEKKDYPVCTECRKPMRKLISKPNIQFKGSGFYVNDYKNK